MKNFRHRNIAQLYSNFVTNDGNELVSVMEICNSDLRKCIEGQNKTPFPFETVMDWSCQMLCGLKYLHEKNMVHRDIKPEVSSSSSRKSYCQLFFNNSILAHVDCWRHFEDWRFPSV